MSHQDPSTPSYTTVMSLIGEGLSTDRDISAAIQLSRLSPDEVAQALRQSLIYIPESPLAMAFQAVMNETAHSNPTSETTAN
ncbi:hypothetical protein BT69DRAFT_1275656 [Atractiella rhizophila]|nr:hypothetical protein BT69DRAFT_1275656 [Atractiella rhizophila]